MDQNSLQPTGESPVIIPNVGACYGHGWRQMWKYILELLLISILSFLISTCRSRAFGGPLGPNELFAFHSPEHPIYRTGVRGSAKFSNFFH